MSTVDEAIQALKKWARKHNFHVSMISMDLLPEGTDEENNTPYDLMQQTYDWRHAGIFKDYDLPDKDTVFHVDLTAANMAYIGRALEVYDKLHLEIHMEPVIENMIKMMGGEQ